ncbi:hypothetical protein MMC31_003210 [Peltigera leucophlebia]|nr:hypothetical protein [Peltigera leucophlebia]
MVHLDPLSTAKPLRLNLPSSEFNDAQFFLDHGSEPQQDDSPEEEELAALDGPGILHEGDRSPSSRKDSEIGTPEEVTGLTGNVQLAESNTAAGGRVSAWVAKQKVFETPESRSKDPLLSRPWASTESTGILPDINIKLPNLSSISIKEGFNGQRTDSRPRRADSSSSPSPNYAAVAHGDMARRNKSPSPDSPEPADVPQIPESILPKPDSLGRIAEERRASIVHGTSRVPSLRRLKSVPSWILRHTTSHGSTFGEDSAWYRLLDRRYG